METKDAEMHVENSKQEVVEDAGIEYTEQADLKEVDSTDEGIAKIVERLEKDEWKENFYGFDDLRSLYKHRPEQFKAYLPKFKQHISEGVENLRSSICRNALILCEEVFATDKNLREKGENGEPTPYAAFVEEILPVCCKKLADDKVFISSRAKAATEAITQHCYGTEVTNQLCDLSRSKSLVIASEANNALMENCKLFDVEYCKQKENVGTLLKILSEDLVSKRQPFTKNSKLMLKTFKDKIGDEEFQNVARESLGSEDEVK
jgi:uncharacterized protein YeaO (DUF488 family)